jgi:hypothetical protein
MAKFTLEDTIKTFNYSQAAVVYWYCEGYSNADIAAMLNYEVSWVIWRMSEVYYKLGLDRPDEKGRKLHWTARRRILREAVCPILKRLTKDDPDFLERFPLIEPNVLAGSILDLRPDIPVPPSEPFIPPPEPPSEPPPLPPDDQIPPPEPPPDFYPIELYNAWLAVLEDDAHDPDGEPLPPPPPIIVGPGRRGRRWGPLIGLGLAVLLGCIAVGALAYWLGRNGGFVPATQTSVPTIQPTLTITNALSPTIQVTETPLPANTLTSTLTITPTETYTPMPTNTVPPVNLTKGAVLQDNRVTLKFQEIKFEQGRTRTGQRPPAPIVFEFDFTNHSGETILLQIGQDKFRAEDNLGNKLTCEFWNGVTEAVETIQQSLENGKTFDLGVYCGEGKIPPGVTTYTLYVTNFSSLPDSTWVANVPR